MRLFSLTFLFLSVLVFISLKTNGQVNSSARFTALANAGTALEDVFSLRGSNQAGITSIKSLKLAFVFEEHFFSSDTRSFAAMLVLPTTIGNLGLYANRYSFERSFEEISAGLTYSRFLVPKLSWATTINYHSLSVSKHDSHNAISLDLGFQYHLTKEWLWGMHLVNPLGLIVNKESVYELPIKLRLGTSYVFSSQLLLAIESEYDWDQHSDFRLGLEYSVLSWLKLRGGTSVSPFQHFVGVGFEFQRLNIDLASSFHPQLGVSPQLSVSYGF